MRSLRHTPIISVIKNSIVNQEWIGSDHKKRRGIFSLFLAPRARLLRLPHLGQN